MSGLDVEALLESAANGSPEPVERRSADRDDHHKNTRNDRRTRDRARDNSRDRYPDRKRRDRSRERSKREKTADRDEDSKSQRSDLGSANGSLKSSRRRSRSRDRRDRRRGSGEADDSYRSSGGDYYRGPGRTRTRSPDGDRYWRPTRSRRDDRDDDRDRDRQRERHGGRDGRGSYGRRRSPSPKRDRAKSKTPPLTEDERDRRTVFVQQLAARLRTKDLIGFFEKVGPVKEAQIVKDRVSGRSKGVGYVEFRNEESVALAIQLTGQQLLGIPIIAQLTEAEKNRQARTTEGQSNSTGVPFHRLYVGNIHFSITESDLTNVFTPFGELEFVQLQKEEQGRSRGYGFVQFVDPDCAKEALEKMNGFDLAGRPIRVGLGNDKFTSESTANLLQRFPNQPPGNFQGSAFSGSGGRGAHAGGSGNFDRIGGRDNEKGAGGASALDDTDVAGVNFNNYSRDSLMRKLARTDEPAELAGVDKGKVTRPKTEVRSLPVNVPQASRGICVKNMFNAERMLAEDGPNWVKLLEDEIREECETKFGHVVHIAVDATSEEGEVYVKFSSVDGGEKAIQGLNGRHFAGQTISAAPVVDALYSSMYGRTRAL